MQYLLNRFPVFVFMVILCSVMCIALTLFFAYHMYLVKLGFTTNEKIKRSCLEDDLERAIRRKLMAVKDLQDISTEEKKAKYIAIKEELGSLKEREKKLKVLSYSKGFWTNLKEIIQA